MEEYTPMTKEEFMEQNPFGVIQTDNDGTPRPLTQEEYDEFVENSRGIWEDNNA
jgi:hypothetical protein